MPLKAVILIVCQGASTIPVTLSSTRAPSGSMRWICWLSTAQPAIHPPRLRPRRFPPITESVFGRLFYLVDDDHFDRRLDRFQLQSQLLLDCREQVRRCVGVGSRG